MPAKYTAQERIKIIEKVIFGKEKVAKVCRQADISRVLFYRWLKRYQQEQNKLPSYPTLSPSIKARLIQRVEAGDSVANVCRENNISRTIFYRWKKRYDQAAKEDKLNVLIPTRKRLERYFRQTPEKYEQTVLDSVSRHPEYGIRKIVANLPKVAGVPIVGHHGVQNVLRRHNLSLYEQRLAYSQGQITPAVKLISRVETTFARLFALPIQRRRSVIRFAGITALTFFSTIVVFGLMGYYSTIFRGAEPASRIGLILASIALATGSFFFAYSMKYYLTLALVLSFSRQAVEGENGEAINKQINGNGGWTALFKKIFGINSDNNNNAGLPVEALAKAGGLQPNLSHIKIKRYPFISIHLPFYNEKNVAQRILSACTSFDYPNYEVIVCDDSTDQTANIVQKFAREHNARYPKGPVIKVLHRPNREGYKGGALQFALKAMNPKTEFVVIFDADFVPYPDTLEQFLKYFKATGGWDENRNYQANSLTAIPYDTFSKVAIGSKQQKLLNKQAENLRRKSETACVAGYQWHVLNKSENWITQGVRSEYAGSYVIERPGQEILGALKLIHGSVYAIRADVLKHFGWGTSITEDFELTLRIYEKGFKVIYTPYVQAPSECVATIKRLIRQRMRWAEGHSFNVKKMAKALLFNPHLSPMEKLEFLYISPYYLQAFFFLVGTFCWLISETVFRARLPFWTSLWGWSLVLTNFFALPLVNGVGLFLEEAEDRDYLGLLSFVVLSYLLVPFQAYASVKGFIEEREGPWFRTPKTGKITDIFTRGKFYRWLVGILPGRKPAYSPAPAFAPLNPYFALTTANNRFDSFNIRSKRARFIGNLVLIMALVSSFSLSYLGTDIKTGSLSDLPIQARIERTGKGGSFLSRVYKIFSPKEVLAATEKAQGMVVSGVKKIPTETLVASLLLLLFITITFLIHLYKRKRKLFKKAVKSILVFALVFSWLLTSWPVILNNPRIPPKIKEVQAAFDERTETNAQGSTLSSPYQVTLNVPASTANGDLMFTWIGSFSATVTTNAAWTLLGSYTAATDKYYLYARVASSEPASYVWTFSGTSKYKATCTTYIASSDFDVTNVSTDLTVSNTSYRTSNTTNRAASFSVPDANSPLLFFGGVYSTTVRTQTPPTNPGTFIEDYDAGSTTPDFSLEIAYYIWAGSGSSGNIDSVISATLTTKHAFAVALKPAPEVPGIAGSVGKSTDGWGGAVPVYGTLTGGLSQGDYPYARAKVDTAASQTFYTAMTWDSGDSRFEGTIYPGSNYCNGCVDPTTGTFTVTVQLDNDPNFGSIDYTGGTSFSTSVTRRRSSTGGTTDYAKYSAVWSTDHWNVQAYDFDLYTDSGTLTNAVIGMAFHPTTATISITQVRFANGAWDTTQDAVDGTGNGWWWDSTTHTMYVRVASLSTTATNLDFEFTSSTDLWATRFDNVQTTDMGERDFWNGLYINNRYYTTSIYGSSTNVAYSGTNHDNDGVQAESRAHRDGTLENVTTDCMERAAMHVGPDGGGTPSVARQDNSADYSYDIKWKANNFATYIQSENDNQIVSYQTSDDEGSCTGGNIQAWAQYCDNQIAAERIQTFYAGKAYLKNYYKFTNNDSASHYYDFIWGREQWLNNSATSSNDRGMTYESNPKTNEWSGVDDENPDQPTSAYPWFAAYDTGVNLMMGVCYESDNIATNNYFLTYAPLQSGSTAAEWPIDHSQTGTDAADTFFHKSFGNVSAGSSVEYTFWQFNYYGSSFDDLKSRIDTDCTVLNTTTYNQSAYRWFNNTDSTDVGSALANQDTAATLGSAGAAFRLRMLLHIDAKNLAQSGQDFKIQYVGKGTGTCASPTGGTPASYTDVTTSTAISYKDNATPADGVALTANVNDPTHGGDTIVVQTYEEANNFTNSQGAINKGRDGKWDFALYDNGATANSVYCFRAVKSDGGVLDTYSVYPEITAVPENPLLLFGLYPLVAGFLKKLKRKRIK